MRILLHMCCGPCAIMPVRTLQEAGHDITGFFYNPNVQPLAEYLRRREAAAQVAHAHNIPLLFPQPAQEQPESGSSEYDLSTWCQTALAYPGGRCLYCRESRFDAAAQFARRHGFTAFTSSLLYSRHQDHAGMRKAGENAEKKYGIHFLYQDFRPYWQQGIDASKELGIYRQPYCGCVFSEADRYAKALKRAVLAG